MKEYNVEKETIDEYKFLFWLKDNIINVFELPNNGNYYEELFFKYQKIKNL
jgi:hypothetical protein